jgi:hypothetical protein
VLNDIKDCYGVMELADLKPCALPAGLDNFRSAWGKRKQLRFIAVFGFDLNPVKGLKTA